ncbi:hypothetical protein H4Q26_000681 [Puccinia striiformis f. sp. tritici PST-130]|nr:hypothetical protein H4Q26_000681 [Puccinia striiformis f. sp. tritici PST-130]
MDYYSIVGVSASADSNQITSAYRKASLKVHPDRNPDDPLASEKFQALKAAFEILQDPIKRAEFDSKRVAQAARAARFEGLDNKRKAMTRDLEAREQAYLKQKLNLYKKMPKLENLMTLKLLVSNYVKLECPPNPILPIQYQQQQLPIHSQLPPKCLLHHPLHLNPSKVAILYNVLYDSSGLKRNCQD